MKTLKYKKSELCELANLVKEDTFESIFSGNIEINLSFLVKGEKTTLSISGDYEEISIINLMQILRKKLSNFLFLKVSVMNLEINLNGEKADANLFGLDTVFTGKRDQRYKLFNAWLIVLFASYFSIESNPTGNEI